ncbi:MAG: nitrous oxide reductase family maturation protein NosD, partial [Thermoplasmata archaeon]|nr:nitrous oxide reductase family maturation protein NosD [Thermoplasmata archaeon]
MVTFTFLSGNVAAADLYVGGPGPGNYTTIQEAIDISIAGDTIYVYNGTYQEDLVINKGIALIGEDTANTIIDGTGAESTIEVLVNDVNISK